jgi:hypothetical protein
MTTLTAAQFLKPYDKIVSRFLMSLPEKFVTVMSIVDNNESYHRHRRGRGLFRLSQNLRDGSTARRMFFYHATHDFVQDFVSSQEKGISL